MVTTNPEGSVHDEQFGTEKKVAENEEKNNNEEKKEVDGNIEERSGTVEPTEDIEAGEVTPEPTGNSDAENKAELQSGEPIETSSTAAAGEVSAAEPNVNTEDKTAALEPEAAPSDDIQQPAEEETVTSEPEAAPSDDIQQPAEDRYLDMDPAELEEIKLPPVDYSGYTKNDLVETLALLVDNRPPSEIKGDVERIKSLFFKKLKVEGEERKQKFLEEGGNIEEYRAWVDPLNYRVKEILNKYREKKIDYGRIQEVEKNENLKKKYEIIDQIKDLVNREESINKTFQEFRALQSQWRSIGAVPQSALKELWENYHHNVEIFYDYIKINNELRDLDLRKNLEAKIELCEKAEKLIDESNVVNAFKKLQEYHDQWREIGPVPIEEKEATWERFKEATTVINKNHHDYFNRQKEEQKKNLEAKIALCEEVEAINKLELKSFKEFNEKAEIVIGIQQKWRKIGFTPKKQNNKIYQRFREACDHFFEKKRDFYNENKDLQQANVQKKIELCEKAEALQDSSDWKATTDMLIQLQKEWKEIGQTPRKQSDKCWKRFRKACDHFFNRKAEFFAEIDTTYSDNLKAKLALIEEINNFVPDTDPHVSVEKLEEFQQRWSEIGFVPFNKKEEVGNAFKNAINRQFDKLKIENEEINVLKYKSKLDNLKSNPKVSRKVRIEREKFMAKIKQLESDISLWENNIGFFAKSANAESMIKEVEAKIENAKKTIISLEEKVKIIDQSGLDE
ncbi:MAG TPA: DUF349 domain-containing protein [Bacteroidetes bacterium]|nr:DUF349 domain-containing protein [Bacteroidota bacterium]